MIKIVTDSTSNLDKFSAGSLGVIVAPSHLIFKDKQIRENEITQAELEQRIINNKEMPMTAPASAADYVKIFQDLVSAEPDIKTIFSIHISSKLSNHYNNASIAANNVKRLSANFPEIIVVDTKIADIGVGLIVLEAAKAAKAGKNKDEIKMLVDGLVEKIKGYIYVDTLDFLVQGGRVSRLSGLLGGLFGIKPILTVESGEILLKDKMKGKENALDRLLNLIEGDCGGKGQSIKVGVVDMADTSAGNDLMAKIESNFTIVEKIRRSFCASVSVHTGPGSLGVFFYKV